MWTNLIVVRYFFSQFVNDLGEPLLGTHGHKLGHPTLLCL